MYKVQCTLYNVQYSTYIHRTLYCILEAVHFKIKFKLSHVKKKKQIGGSIGFVVAKFILLVGQFALWWPSLFYWWVNQLCGGQVYSIGGSICFVQAQFILLVGQFALWWPSRFIPYVLCRMPSLIQRILHLSATSFAVGISTHHQSTVDVGFKGAVSRHFRTLFFFINRTHLGP